MLVGEVSICGMLWGLSVPARPGVPGGDTVAGSGVSGAA